MSVYSQETSTKGCGKSDNYNDWHNHSSGKNVSLLEQGEYKIDGWNIPWMLWCNALQITVVIVMVA